MSSKYTPTREKGYWQWASTELATLTLGEQVQKLEDFGWDIFSTTPTRSGFVMVLMRMSKEAWEAAEAEREEAEELARIETVAKPTVRRVVRVVRQG